MTWFGGQRAPDVVVRALHRAAGMNGLGFSSRGVPRLLGFAADRGVDVRALTTRFGLPADVLERDAVAIALPDFRALGEAVAETLAEPLLGIAIARSVHRHLSGTLDALFLNCRDVRDGLQQLVRFQSLLGSPSHVAKIEAEAEIGVELRVYGALAGGGRTHAEWMAACTLESIRELARAPIVARRVWFASPAPAARDALADYFGTTDLSFDQTSDGITFDAAVGDLRSTFASSEARAALLRVAEAEAAALAPGELLFQVRARVRAGLENGPPSLDAVAKSFGMSERTFQRRIRALGFSFNALLDDERRSLAIARLADDRIQLDALPVALGYVQKEAFWRAFKRWTGTTPARFRREVLARVGSEAAPHAEGGASTTVHYG